MVRRGGGKRERPTLVKHWGDHGDIGQVPWPFGVGEVCYDRIARAQGVDWESAQDGSEDRRHDAEMQRGADLRLGQHLPIRQREGR